MGPRSWLGPTQVMGMQPPLHFTTPPPPPLASPSSTSPPPHHYPKGPWPSVKGRKSPPPLSTNFHFEIFSRSGLAPSGQAGKKKTKIKKWKEGRPPPPRAPSSCRTWDFRPKFAWGGWFKHATRGRTLWKVGDLEKGVGALGWWRDARGGGGGVRRGRVMWWGRFINNHIFFYFYDSEKNNYNNLLIFFLNLHWIRYRFFILLFEFIYSTKDPT
nr:hypothetical protein [Morchella crassipes]